jgi:hypothetical protein
MGMISLILEIKLILLVRDVFESGLCEFDPNTHVPLYNSDMSELEVRVTLLVLSLMVMGF